MNLAEKLKSIATELAMPAWPDTTRHLSIIMHDRARAGGWGAILVAVHSAAVESLLTEWAIEQGLEVSPSTGCFTRSLWLAWGHKPRVGGNCDAEVLHDGTLFVPKPKD